MNDNFTTEQEAGLSELCCKRLKALQNVNVHGETQAEAVRIAAAAIEAHDRGPDAYASFVRAQRGNGMTLEDVSKHLWYLPKEQPERTASAIAFAKKIVAHDDYIRILECSERGDARFSPFQAELNIRGVKRCIAEIYQNAKRAADGSHVEAGESFDHFICPYTGDQFPAKEAPWLYRGLWIAYFSSNPELLKYAEQFNGFSNIFSSPGLENRYDEIIEAYVLGDRSRYVAVVQCSDWYKNMKNKLKAPLNRQIDSAHDRAVTSLSSGKAPVKEVFSERL